MDGIMEMNCSPFLGCVDRDCELKIFKPCIVFLLTILPLETRCIANSLLFNLKKLLSKYASSIAFKSTIPPPSFESAGPFELSDRGPLCNHLSSFQIFGVHSGFS